MTDRQSRVVVLGGGIAGLTAARRLGQALEVSLVEAAPRLGGKILTDRRDGFVLEGGPDSFIPQKPQALELVRELGLDDRLLPSRDERRGTFIFHRGRLVQVPEGLQMLVPSDWGAFLRSPLLSWPAKLRFALEGLVPRRRGGGDESLADFVRRRLGRGALEPLAEPLLAHLHVADVERLSLAATYPRLAELETRYGSLQRAVRQLRKRRLPEMDRGPLFWTLKGGLGELVEALASRLDRSSLLLGRRAVRLRRSELGGYAVGLDDGREIEAAAVILAVPAAAAADLVAGFDDGLADRLHAPYASMATLSLAYRRRDLGRGTADRGFGFFVPRREGRRILAGSWTSAKFDHRAPEDHVLLRLFLGGALQISPPAPQGALQQDLLELDDGALVDAVERDLGEIAGVRARPVLRRLFRWPRGYPQYQVGHRERVRAIEASLPPGLHLAGSAWHGVGLPDCIRSGTEAADAVRRSLERERPAAIPP